MHAIVWSGSLLEYPGFAGEKSSSCMSPVFPPVVGSFGKSVYGLRRQISSPKAAMPGSECSFGILFSTFRVCALVQIRSSVGRSQVIGSRLHPLPHRRYDDEGHAAM